MANPITTMALGVATTGIAVATRRPWGSKANTFLASQEFIDEPGQLMSNLATVLHDAAWKKKSIAVVVGDALVRLFMVSPPANARSPGDLQLAASLRFQALYGEAPEQWSICGAWSAHRRFLACALPGEFRIKLHAACAIQALRITALQPHFVAAWNFWRNQLPENAWFGVFHEDLLSVGVVTAAGLADVRRLAVSAQARLDPGWLTEMLERESLRAGLALPSGICCCGSVPPAWLEQAAGRPAAFKAGRPRQETPISHGPGGRLLGSIGEMTWH